MGTVDKQVEVCDVLVVGGGMAGLSAALAAVRGGAKTVLLEKRDVLGGTYSAGLDFPVCGLFDRFGRVLNGGLCSELFGALDIPGERVGRVFVWPVDPAKVLGWFDAQFRKYPKLKIMKGCEATSVEVLSEMIYSVKGEGVYISPSVVVDCSGDAAAARLGSANVIEPETRMMAGCTIRFEGIEPDGMLPLKVPMALRNSEIPDYLFFSVFSLPGSLKLALPPDHSEEEMQGDIDLLVGILREKIPAFASARVVDSSPFVLRREGVRMLGKHVLTQAEVLGGARFSDAVARNAWPVESWEEGTGQRLEYIVDGDYHEIPRKCLESLNIRNLLAAGRCISATSGALASSRVTGVCIATGEAAGRIAAEMCK